MTCWEVDKQEDCKQWEALILGILGTEVLSELAFKLALTAVGDAIRQGQGPEIPEGKDMH